MPDSLPVLICRSIKADSGYQAMDRRQGNGIGFLRQSSSAAGIATADLVYPRRRQKSNQWLLELFSEDKECDFFHDVAHIQKNKTHKGLAASSQTATASRAEQRKSAIAGLSGLIIPLLLQSILEGKAKQNYLGQKDQGSPQENTFVRPLLLFCRLELECILEALESIDCGSWKW